MSSFGSDLRLAVRLLVRRPGFTALALITLTIGVAANTVVFSLVNGVFLKPLPEVRQPDQLIEVALRVGAHAVDFSYPVLEAIRAEPGVVAEAAGMVVTPVSVGRDGPPVVRLALNTTGNYFTLLGVPPGLGRYFAPEESLPPADVPVTVISDRLWRDLFEASPAAIGQVLRVNGMALQVIGVAPPGFRGHVVATDVDLYVPLGVAVPGLQTAAGLANASSGSLQVLARLSRGTSSAQASAALTLAARRALTAAGVARPETYTVEAEGFSPVPLAIRTGVAAFLAALLVVSGVLLLMTCISVAGMFLARATERHSELVVRRALGASRRRITVQLLTESLVFFVLAGTAGALVAGWIAPLLAALRPPLPPGFSLDFDLALDWRVAGWAALVSGIAGVLVSLPPALGASRADLAPGLREHGVTAVPTRRRLRSTLVGVQMAATVFLLAVGGLFIRSLGSLDRLDPGWNPDEVVVTRVDLELAGIDAESGPVVYEELRRRVGALPGVEQAAFVAKLPFGGQSSLGLVRPETAEGSADESGSVAFFNRVTPGYFRTMGVTLLRGRDFSDVDHAGSPSVAVVSAAMAERLWPGQSPLGQRFVVGGPGAERSLEVVGVAENTVVRRLNETPVSFYYLPHNQLYNQAMLLVVRTRLSPAEVTSGVHAAVAAVAPQLPVDELLPMRETLSVFFLPQRLAAWVAGLLGLMGLLIGVVGVYGMAAVAALQRRREMGIRLALGSRPAEVLSLLVTQTTRAPLIGMGIGLVLALAGAQVLARFLAGLNPTDPVTFGSVVLGLGLSCLLATWLPARRVAAMDPGRTLREG